MFFEERFTRLEMSLICKYVIAISTCSTFRRKREFNPSDIAMSISESHDVTSKTGDFKHSQDLMLPKRKVRASESSFVIPSVRHFREKDFLYKPLRPVAKALVPPPPAIPTNSELNQATRKTVRHSFASEEKSG